MNFLVDEIQLPSACSRFHSKLHHQDREKQ
jgi:hypothetical protein